MRNYLVKTEDELKLKLYDEKTRYQGTIYHYTSADGLKSIIQTKKLWFTNTKFLNDYSENNYIFELLSENIDSYKSFIDDNFIDDIKDIIAKYKTGIIYQYQSRTLFPDHVYVSSFSKSKDNLEMWNYYTKSNNSIGYNIAFEHCPFIVDSNILKFINGEVIYNKETQLVLLKNILDKYNKIYVRFVDDILRDSKSRENFLMSYVRMLELYNIFFKHEAYKNEQEYRCAIYDVTNYAGIEPKSRNISGLLVPYIEIDYNFNSIDSIGISPASESELLKEGVKFMLFSVTKGNQDYIKVWSSQIPRRY